MTKGRPTQKVANLRRFTEQWQDFTNETQELIEFDAEDADYISGALHWDNDPLDKINNITSTLEV